MQGANKDQARTTMMGLIDDQEKSAMAHIFDTENFTGIVADYCDKEGWVEYQELVKDIAICSMDKQLLANAKQLREFFRKVAVAKAAGEVYSKGEQAE